MFRRFFDYPETDVYNQGCSTCWVSVGYGEETRSVQLVEAQRAKSQPLAEDYTVHYSKVSERFDYSPWNPDDWAKRADWVRAAEPLRMNRAAMVQTLTTYNEGIGNSSSQTARSLELLADPKSLVVVGGQQAGLFTGPLLVIHKAVTILRTAKEASERLGRPVVPVFWIAGEDHDYDEVNHWNALSSQLTVERFRLEHPTGIRTSISRLRFEEWTEALSRMDEWLPQSDYKPHLMEQLHRLGERSATLTDYFARIMGWLFGSHGLVLLDSDDPNLRKLEVPLFEGFLEKRNAINRHVRQARENVEQLGYVPQAEQPEGSVNLFYFDDRGERILLLDSEGVITDRKRSFQMDPEQTAKLMREQPERFSNNVMTRPVMQDYVLPVLAVVLGPGEIAYWALTREIFHEMGFRMPVLVPRLEFTLVEGSIQKNLEKFGLSYDDVMDRFDEKRSEWLAGQGHQETEELFAETKRRFEELYRPVVEAVSALNPGLGKLGETNRQKIMDQIEFLRVKAADAMESKYSNGLRQLDRVRVSLAPLSKPQERVYNVFAYLNKYGESWLDELIQLPYGNDGRHRLVFF